MPVLRGPVADDGCLVSVIIGWSYSRVLELRRAHRPVPAPVEATALIDTGAEVTCLNRRLIEELDLPDGGIVAANTPALQGMTFAFTHDASLSILHPAGDHLMVRNLTVLDLDLDLLGYQAVLGRDVLSRCKFLFDGIGQSYTLKY